MRAAGRFVLDSDDFPILEYCDARRAAPDVYYRPVGDLIYGVCSRRLFDCDSQKGF